MISEKMGSSPRKAMAYKYNNCFMVLLKQHKKTKKHGDRADIESGYNML